MKENHNGNNNKKDSLWLDLKVHNLKNKILNLKLKIFHQYLR